MTSSGCKGKKQLESGGKDEIFFFAPHFQKRECRCFGVVADQKGKR